MVQIEWTNRSKNDLKNIADYIAKGSKHYAKVEVLKIKNRFNILTTYKSIGRIVPEINRKDIRELIQGNYRIIYKIVKVAKFFKSLKIEETEGHFNKNFTNFMKLKFLFKLKENEGVIYTLNIVFSKKINYNFLEEKEKWNLAIEKIKTEINFSINSLLNDLKIKLND